MFTENTWYARPTTGEGEARIVDSHGSVIASGIAKAQAELIVRAHNDDLRLHEQELRKELYLPAA